VISCVFPLPGVFWIGPILGALAAALIYKFAFRHPDAIAEDERAAAALAAASKLAEEEHAASLLLDSHKPSDVSLPVSSPQRVTSAVGTSSQREGAAAGAASEWHEASSSYRAVSVDAPWHAEGSGGASDLSSVDLLRAR
jgi:hypothetical protein